MRIEFDIPDEKVQNLSQNGKTELTRHSKLLTEEIVDEASRIEASRRNPNTNTEVTAAIVNEAAVYSRRFPPKPKKSVLTKIIQLSAFISSLVAGSMLDTDKFKETNHVVWFIVALFVAIGSTVYLTFNNENNG